MRFHGTLALALLAPAAVARPGLEERAGCLNACFQSAFARTTASSDCASFYRATVELCPTTTTSTVYHVTLAPAPTVYRTATVTTISSTTTTKVATTVLTNYQTAYAPATVTATDVKTDPVNTPTVTEFATTTVFATSTVTVSSTTTTYDDLPAQRRELEARAGCTTASTVVATAIPSYARSCGATPGNGVYSSVCSCYGATHARTTLPRPSARTIVTISSTSTPPASTIIATHTVVGGTQYITVYSTAVSRTTTTTTSTMTTTSLVFVTVTNTVTRYVPAYTTTTASTTTTTATSTVSITACRVTQVSGPTAGAYLYAAPNTGDIMGFTSDSSSAGHYFLDGQGQLTSAQGFWLAKDDDMSYIHLQTTTQQGGDIQPLTCTTDANAVLSCVSSGPVQRNNLFCMSANGLVSFCDQSDASSMFTVVSMGFDCET